MHAHSLNTQACRHRYVAHKTTHTHLLLEAYPVSRLQGPLQEGEAKLVYGRSVEIVLHKAVTGREESQWKLCSVLNNYLKVADKFT